MDISVKELDSGIKYVFRRISSPVAYCALTIRAGTRDESIAHNGIAHLTEHMLFKGTTSKGAKRINNFLEKLGGELNAYTTKEETVIHATMLKEDIGKAVELISDLVFNSVYPQKELIKEKDVVLKEIASYRDTPSEQIFDDFDEFLFGEHSLAMPILGKPNSVKRIGVENIKEFTRRFYYTGNMSFSIVADISETRGEWLVRKHFDKRDNNGLGTFLPNSGQAQNITIPLDRERRVSKKTYQAHCVAGIPAYNLYSNKRLPLALLTNIVGGPALNSKLNQVLREKYALVYTVDAHYTPYSDTGLLSIYFGTDKANLNKSLEILDGELLKIRENKISATSLKSFKKQLLGQLAISTDNAESQSLALGKSLLFFGEVEPIEVIREKIEEIDSDTLLEVANELFNREKMFTLIYS